jgi:hypothetical protein
MSTKYDSLCNFLDSPVISFLVGPNILLINLFLNILSLCPSINVRDQFSHPYSGSIVSDYGLDDQAIGVRSPAGAKDFSSSLCVQTGSWAHPASCPMGTGGPFPGVKRGRGVMLTTHAHPVPRS